MGSGCEMKIITPRGRTIEVQTKGGKQKAILEWNHNFQNKWNGKFSRVQKYVDSEVLRLSDKYTPFKSGFLKKSGILGTDIGSGEVQYIAPYSRYQYHGKVMIGKAPKKVTNKDLQYNGAPQRGAKWFEVMKVNHKEDIFRGARRFLE